MSNKVWTDEYTVQSYNIDFTSKARLTSICRLFQESAWRHASDANLGYHDLLKNNHVWVLYKLKLEINEFPEWIDKINLTTWAKKTDRLFAYRDFEIRKADNESKILIKGTSKWLIIDLKNKRPQKMDAYASSMPLNKKEAISENNEKVPVYNEFDSSETRKVVYSDIDINHHVNNVKYIEWILDMYSLEHLKNSHLIKFEIDYKHEAEFGEEIELKAKYKNDNHSFLASNEEGKEIFRAYMVWEKK